MPCIFCENYSLALPKVNPTLYGIDTIRYIGKELWQSLPIEMKESQPQEIFEQKIKFIRNFECSCRLCNNSFSQSRFFLALVSFSFNKSYLFCIDGFN